MSKRLIILLVVLALSIAILLKVSGLLEKKPTPSPEGDFSALLEAMKTGDADAYLTYFTKESQEMILRSPKLQPTAEKMAKDLEKYKKGRFQLVEQTKERAVMMSGAYGYIVYVKEDGEWKIDLKASLEKMYGEIPD